MRILIILAAIVLLLVVTAAGVWFFFQDRLQSMVLQSMAIDEPYEALPLPPAPEYTIEGNWAAHPETDDPADAVPPGVEPPQAPGIPVFYIHPTNYLKTGHWNAPLDDAQALVILERTLSGQASAFNAAGPVWAPRYRQAAFAAFLERKPAATRAILTAYRDVERAFDRFLEEIGDQPFILAGHSQGALHGLLLLQNRVQGDRSEQLVAAYLPGWPIGETEDLGALQGVRECSEPRMTGCVVSWQSFAANGDPSRVKDAFVGQPGLSGVQKSGDTMVCVNPVTGRADASSAKSQHSGAVAPAGADLKAPTEPLVAARCGEDGILYLEPAPGGDFDDFLLPGENYHVYDIPLFYMDVRADVRRRAEVFMAQ
jgi:hypothetical protein